MNFWLRRLLPRGLSRFLLRRKWANGHLFAALRSHWSRSLILSLEHLALYHSDLFLWFSNLFGQLLFFRRWLCCLRIIEALIFRVQSSFLLTWLSLKRTDPASVSALIAIIFSFSRFWITRVSPPRSLFSNLSKLIPIIKGVLKDLKGLLWSHSCTVDLLHLFPYFFNWKTNKIFSGPLHTIICDLLHWSITWGWLDTLLVQNVISVSHTTAACWLGSIARSFH